MVHVATTADELTDEEARMNELLRGKTIDVVRRNKAGALVVFFEDGTRLFVDHRTDGFEFSITG
ncbi:hypothetical protein [Aminobacter ciceronei]|jgi:hypothetical protein|uniref:hypothetical protein n=1 Tax=Aminobacter ciceronei TaxID=150723 RepID=UPI003F6ECCCB